MKHGKKKRKLTALWISLGVFVGVLIVLYGVGAYYFSSHFGFNTSIDSYNSSFKTVEEVEKFISDNVDKHEMVIKGREGLSKTIKAADVNLEYVSDGQVAEILAGQNHFLWFTRLFRDPSASTTHASVRYDLTKFKNVLDKLGLFDEKNNRPPADAYYEFKNSAYTIHPEDLGTQLDKSKASAELAEAMRTLTTSFDLNEARCYFDPDVYANNQGLQKTVDTYNTYVPFCIAYTFGDEVEMLDGSVTLDWIDIAEDGTGTLNMDAVQAWVRDFGLRHDSVGSVRNFKTAEGEDATVEGGTYGWEVDEELELEAILNAYENHSGETREPYYVQTATEHTAPGSEAPDWGTTYIELDLTNQHMYYIVEGEVAFDAPVVTGAPWGGRSTPAGVYSILEMRSPAILKGEIQSNGKPEYETPVSYWMRMTWAGHGFHDATWQPWFGGDRYQYAGSHGCINMSYSDAQSLFSMIEEGLPVVSHY